MLAKLLKHNKFYIVLDDYDFAWRPHDVEAVVSMWREDAHIADIAENVRCPVIEVAVLIMDLAEKGIISARRGGAFGREWKSDYSF